MTLVSEADCKRTGPQTPPGLVYVSDSEPGILRRRRGKGFSYRYPDGAPLDATERLRVSSLGVPPAYSNVWICTLPNGHLQATGLDARGRKQYRYHADWQAAQAETRFSQLAAFGESLPKIRRRLNSDLRGEAGDMAFSLAALVMLIDRTYLRVGNACYTAQNRTFGASTLLNRHLTLQDGAMRLSFRAKGGKRVQHTLRDGRLSRVLNDIGDLPGRALFTYIDDDGQPRALSSQDVNAWLAGIAGSGVTAKTFRTWGGTLAAFEAARQTEPDRQATVKALTVAAAGRLNNTPAICRKSYIHPAVMALSELPAAERCDLLGNLDVSGTSDLRVEERRLLAFLHTTAVD